jgi:serine/threonine protein phosphatase PrpC
VRYAALTETGKVRDNNEDAYHADGRIFIVADGMGGHRAGEVASSSAIEEFLRFERENPHLNPKQRMREGILSANRMLFAMAQDDPGLEGMGTTFTGVLIEKGVYLGHVGDSRAYLWRKGGLRLLTRDHSLVERMVSQGYISRVEARFHPQRNIILRALGVADGLEVDLESLSVTPGDRMLICSDGLTGFVEDDDLEVIVSGVDDPEECCRRLVDTANERGGADNITVILIAFEEFESGGISLDGRDRKTWLRWPFRRKAGKASRDASDYRETGSSGA